MKRYWKIIIPVVVALCLIIAAIVYITQRSADTDMEVTGDGTPGTTESMLDATNDSAAGDADTGSTTSGNTASGNTASGNTASGTDISGNPSSGNVTGETAAEVEESINKDGSRTVVVTGSDGSSTQIVIQSEDGSQQQVSSGQQVSSDQQSASSSTKESKDSKAIDYEEYCKMSGKEQYAYYESFASADDFFEWYNAAKKAYQAANPAIEIGNGDKIEITE